MAADENGSLGSANMPMWARIVMTVGFPAAVAGVLLMVFVKQLDAHHTLLEEHSDAMRSAHNTIMHYQRQLVYMMQIICQNAAQSSEDHSRCVPPGEPNVR